jgi:hypothetical protein
VVHTNSIELPINHLLFLYFRRNHDGHSYILSIITITNIATGFSCVAVTLTNIYNTVINSAIVVNPLHSCIIVAIAYRINIRSSITIDLIIGTIVPNVRQSIWQFNSLPILKFLYIYLWFLCLVPYIVLYSEVLLRVQVHIYLIWNNRSIPQGFSLGPYLLSAVLPSIISANIVTCLQQLL